MHKKKLFIIYGTTCDTFLNFFMIPILVQNLLTLDFRGFAVQNEVCHS